MLVTGSECAGKVSSDAIACPRCGLPRNAAPAHAKVAGANAAAPRKQAEPRLPSRSIAYRVASRRWSRCKASIRRHRDSLVTTIDDRLV